MGNEKNEQFGKKFDLENIEFVLEEDPNAKTEFTVDPEIDTDETQEYSDELPDIDDSEIPDSNYEEIDELPELSDSNGDPALNIVNEDKLPRGETSHTRSEQQQDLPDIDSERKEPDAAGNNDDLPELDSQQSSEEHSDDTIDELPEIDEYNNPADSGDEFYGDGTQISNGDGSEAESVDGKEQPSGRENSVEQGNTESDFGTNTEDNESSVGDTQSKSQDDSNVNDGSSDSGQQSPEKFDSQHSADTKTGESVDGSDSTSESKDPDFGNKEVGGRDVESSGTPDRATESHRSDSGSQSPAGSGESSHVTNEAGGAPETPGRFNNMGDRSSLNRNTPMSESSSAKSVPQEVKAPDTKSPELKPAMEKATETAKGKASQSVRNKASQLEAAKKPVFKMPTFFSWEVLAVILAVIATVVIVVFINGVLNVIGHNENIENCIVSTAGGGNFHTGESAFSLTAEQKMQNAATIADYFTSTPMDMNGGDPLSVEQVSGIIGSMWRESHMNPAAVANDYQPATASNADVRAIVSDPTKPIGLIQWLGSRAHAMIDLAESSSRVWSDGNVQVEYLASELNGAEGKALKNAGFFEPGQSIEDYTRIFNRAFVRSCDLIGPTDSISCGINVKYDRRAAGNERLKFAQDFAASYSQGSGGGVSAGGGGSNCVTSGGGFDNSNAVQLAISIAYPASQKNMAKVNSSDKLGGSVAPQAYKDAKASAEAIGGKDPWAGLYASCDRFVATVIKNTTDPDIPWGATRHQFDYLSKSPKWQAYHTKSEARPGDIWITPGSGGSGHVVIYVGNVDGVDSIADASYMQRVGRVSSASHYTEGLVELNGRGRTYTGFRFVGTLPSNVGSN